MKRIKRKQLKEDEFITTFNKFIRFLKKRTKELVALGVLIIFAFLIFVGIKIVSIQKSKKEGQLLTQILDLHSDLKENPDNLAKLEEVAGEGKFSRLAYILLATHWMENGDLDKAQATLEDMPKEKKDIFYYQSQELLASIHTKRKNYDQAIDIYKKIEEENPKEYSMDVILFHQAEAFEKKGEAAEALVLYKKVQDEFPQTFYGYEASQKVRKLEGEK